MAAMPIYGQNLKKNIFSGIKKSMTLHFGMLYWVHEFYQVCSNNDPGRGLTCFTARSNLVPYAFVLSKR